MFAANTYTARRERLLKEVDSGLIVLLGNREVGMNYHANPYHFRQDSTFLYFFGLQHAGLGALLDADSGEVTLFGDDLELDDIVWMGPHPTLIESAVRVGVKNTAAYAEMGKRVQAAKEAGRVVHFLPPYRYRNMYELQQWLGIPIEKQKQEASETLIRAVVAQRSIKSEEEVMEMEKALAITRAMHLAVMKGAKPGKTEAQLAAIAEGIALGMNGHLAYPAILTINGHILHNHDHSHALQTGQLVLGDFGAETDSCYAGDITRTFPVDGRFTEKQKEIYQIVLAAELVGIEACKPGVAYQDVHRKAARILAEGLAALGLMKGDLDEAVAQGAHALFFPHGLGHMIGLDVHDMEDLGEQYVGYSESIHRSDQFGTAYLRLGRELEAGFVLTVEPGIYFIPELIDQWQAEKKFSDFIDYGKVAEYRGFTGVRIEDNVLITADGHRVLGPPIPKSVEEVEAYRNG